MPRRTDEEKLETLRALLQEGIDAIERGDYEVYDAEGLGRLMQNMIDEAVAEEEAKGGHLPIEPHA